MVSLGVKYTFALLFHAIQQSIRHEIGNLFWSFVSRQVIFYLLGSGQVYHCHPLDPRHNKSTKSSGCDMSWKNTKGLTTPHISISTLGSQWKRFRKMGGIQKPWKFTIENTPFAPKGSGIICIIFQGRSVNLRRNIVSFFWKNKLYFAPWKTENLHMDYPKNYSLLGTGSVPSWLLTYNPYITWVVLHPREIQHSIANGPQLVNALHWLMQALILRFNLWKGANKIHPSKSQYDKGSMEVKNGHLPFEEMNISPWFLAYF